MSEENETKDPNINDAGHTLYPKWIEHPTEKDKRGFPKRVIVKHKKAEEELLGKPKGKTSPAPEGGWPAKSPLNN